MWKQIIAEIQEYGDLTQADIGKKCGAPQSTISSLIARGGEPKFSLGEKLKSLHKQVSKRKATANAA